MTPLRHVTLLAVCSFAACTSPDYGEPTSSTTIDLQETTGFINPPLQRGVRIEGTTATYTAGSRTDQATIASSDVAAIIAALEDIEFLALDGDYTHCDNADTDLSIVTIEASLSAGANSLDHYRGCHGRIFDKLSALEQRILDLSGFTAWSVPF